jgi:hypothetical protein
MTWEHELVSANFIHVCDRLGLDYEAALDWDYIDADLTEDELRDLAFGIGYVRGLADAWDCTALEVVTEVTA